MVEEGLVVLITIAGPVMMVVVGILFYVAGQKGIDDE